MQTTTLHRLCGRSSRGCAKVTITPCMCLHMSFHRLVTPVKIRLHKNCTTYIVAKVKPKCQFIPPCVEPCITRHPARSRCLRDIEVLRRRRLLCIDSSLSSETLRNVANKIFSVPTDLITPEGHAVNTRHQASVYP